MGTNKMDRVAFSPGEFAALFGKSQTWGYRQIYAGKVKAITEHGRILIPAAEVESILQKAGIYDGLKTKPAKLKTDILALKPRLQNAWERFLRTRRAGIPDSSPSPKKTRRKEQGPPWSGAQREAALSRLTGGKRV